MKTHILIFFILLISNLYSQDTLLIDSIRVNSGNSISGIYNYNNNSPLININFSGDNGINYKKIIFTTNTVYSLQYNNKIIANELQQKTNINRENVFFLHVFNHSMTRKITYDNSYGLGIGKWWNVGSVSYALIYQKTDYENLTSIEVFRSSFRVKLKYDKPKFSFLYEYYYQPNIKNFKDNIIYGNVKFGFNNHKKINYIITDYVNYRSLSNVKLIHNLSLGINLSFNKK